jgi:hypothetical protein
VVKDFSSEIVEDIPLIPGFRESEIGEISLGVVMDSLVPSYKEIISPIPIPTY